MQNIGIIKAGLTKYARGKIQKSTKTENKQALIDTFVNEVIYYGNKKGKVLYNVTDFSTGSFYEQVVEIIGLEPMTPRM